MTDNRIHENGNGGDVQTPMEILARAYETAPHPIARDFLDQKISEILTVDLSIFGSVMTDGAHVDSELVFTDFSVDDAFQSLRTHVAKIAGDSFTPAASDGAELIARAMDTAIIEILDGQPIASRMALLTLLAQHARIVAMLTRLVPAAEKGRELDS